MPKRKNSVRKKDNIKKKKRGRPSKWTDDIPDRTYKLCLLGLTDQDLCVAFNISERILNYWKKIHPEFLQSIKKGKDNADAEIAKSLYHRAKGYEHEDVHISNYQGEITITPITKHYPPDTTACIFWLKNRQKELWSDVSRHEHTGKDGGPIEQKQIPVLDLSILSDEELALAEKLGLKAKENGAGSGT